MTPDPPIALNPPFITFMNVSMPVNILIYSVTVNQNFSPPKDSAYFIIFENFVGLPFKEFSLTPSHKLSGAGAML